MISSLIAMLIGNNKFKKQLEQCLIVGDAGDKEVFEYDGNIYDKQKFVEIKAASLSSSGMSRRDLQKQLYEYERKLATSETPDLDKAMIAAYKKVL